MVSQFSPGFRFNNPLTAVWRDALASARTMTSVTITAPARLHLGFLDLNGGLGRRFGSLGLSVDGLRTRVNARAADHMQVNGPDSERVRRYADAMRTALDLRAEYDIAVEDVVPPHAGLGSGTQLALALAAAVRRLHGLPLDVEGDAVRLGRGTRSGAGIALFERGGLVVDGGSRATPRAPPMISRLQFPERWRVLVVLDPHRQGAHGAGEANAFARLPPASDTEAAHLCRVLVMKILPAVVEADLPTFGAGIRELQARVGDHFAPAQGGHRFASSTVAATLALLENEGAVGIGQSSWGPTGYAFVPSLDAAERILASVHGRPECKGVDIRICRALNSGAEITANVNADAPELRQ